MILDALLEFIFPSRCTECSATLARNRTICAACFSRIPVNQTLFCGECGSRLARGRRVCHHDFPYILGAAANYDTPAVKNLIHELKFKFVKPAALPLAELLVGYVEGLRFKFNGWLVVPLPLSPKRRRERGFNQAELIAEIFAQRLGLRYATDILRRLKNTKPQSETLTAGERADNVKNCFIANVVAGAAKRVILIDDVVTSGATLREAARVLKTAGVRRILALTVAKA